MLNCNMLNPSVMEQGGPAALQEVESQEQVMATIQPGTVAQPCLQLPYSYSCLGVSLQGY